MAMRPGCGWVERMFVAHLAECATWEGSSQLRLNSGKPLYCHKLDEQDFRAVIDPRRYLDGYVMR